jgi:hypothetical protein
LSGVERWIEAISPDYRQLDVGHLQRGNWPRSLRQDFGSCHRDGFRMNPLRRSLVLAFVALLSACAGNPSPGQGNSPEAASKGLGGTVAGLWEAHRRYGTLP